MSFADIYGHRHQVNILRQCLVQGRLPHAFLFHGIPGTGKLTAAIALAQGINCSNSRDNGDACGQCSGCRKTEEGNHPDLFLINPEGQFIRIDRIREIINRCAFTPMEGQAQVYVLNKADRLNIAAANALLKTLEEPRPDNVIILVTSRLNHLPLTIVSRCRLLRFNPLTTAEVTRYLKKEKEISCELAGQIALQSGGSIGRALDVLHQRQRGRPADLTNLLAIKASGRTTPVNASFFGQDREEIIENLQEWKMLLRDALVCKIRGAHILPQNFPGREAILSWADFFHATMLLNQIDLIDQGIADIERNANKQLTLDILLFKILP